MSSLLHALSVVLNLGFVAGGVAAADDGVEPEPTNTTSPDAHGVIYALDQPPRLPPEGKVQGAERRAREVAATLESAGVIESSTLLVGEAATAEGLFAAFDEAAMKVGPSGMVLVWLEAPGAGSGLVEPGVFDWSTSLDDFVDTSIPVSALAEQLSARLYGRSVLVLTDVVHQGEINQVPLWGPAASHWPKLPDGFVVISAGPADKPSSEGAFGEALVRVLQPGMADATSATQLYRALVSESSGTATLPAIAGGGADSVLLGGTPSVPRRRSGLAVAGGSSLALGFGALAAGWGMERGLEAKLTQGEWADAPDRVTLATDRARDINAVYGAGYGLLSLGAAATVGAVVQGRF